MCGTEHRESVSRASRVACDIELSTLSIVLCTLSKVRLWVGLVPIIDSKPSTQIFPQMPQSQFQSSLSCSPLYSYQNKPFADPPPGRRASSASHRVPPPTVHRASAPGRRRGRIETVLGRLRPRPIDPARCHQRKVFATVKPRRA